MTDRSRKELPETVDQETVVGNPVSGSPEPAGTVSGAPAGSRGRQFGDYELLKEIARGGMGVVYKARHVALNRMVALKMIKSGEFADAEQVSRFHAEAEAAAQLDHPHIVPVYEVGAHNGQHFFSMAYVEGDSLKGILNDGPLPPAEAADLVRTIAEAVQYGHEKAIVHRDLKPANILIGPDGKPRVTDFGLAKRTETDSSLTATGQVLGTPNFMPPEQAAGHSSNVGPKSDVYSLGALLYCLLTGRPPFQAANVMETLRQVVERDPVSPRQLNGAVDQDLATICEKCLEKDPAKRYSSAADLADDLQRYVQGEPITARPVSWWERGWRWVKRHPAWTSVAVFGLVATATSIGLGVAYRYQNRLQGLLSREKQLSQDLGVQATRLHESLERQEQLHDHAEQARQEAERARQEAEKARDAEAAAKQHLDKVLYLRRVALAYQEWKDTEIARAWQLLQSCPERYRHWEWRYVRQLRHVQRLTLSGHTDRLLSVAFSPDGSRIASAGYDDTVKVWDAATGEELLTFQGHAGSVYSVVFSPDGQWIASAGGPSRNGRVTGTAKVWDAATGEEILTLQGHRGLRAPRRAASVYGVAFSPDGERIATVGGADFGANSTGSVKIWDASTGTELLSLDTGYARGVAFNPDGQRIASDAKDAVKIWDVATGEPILMLPGNTVRTAFSPDGSAIATGNVDGSLTVWDAATGEVVRTLSGHSGAVYGVAFSPDGNRIASGSGDKRVKIWDTLSGEEIVTLEGHTGRVNSVAFSPDGSRIASASYDKTVKVWDASLKDEFLTLPAHAHLATCVAFSPDGSRIASASIDGTAKVWDTVTKQNLLTLRGHRAKVYGVAFSPDGARIATGSADKTVRVWDAATGDEILALEGHSDSVRSVAFSPDGRQLASGSWDTTVTLWNARTGEVMHTLRGHSSRVRCVAFSPEGSRIATGCRDKTARVWNVATGEELLTLEGHNSTYCLAFSPDGSRIATAGDDAKVRVWDAVTGKEIFTLGGHNRSVTGVAYSPDGRRLFSSSGDSTVKVWDTSTGEEALTLNHAGRAWSLATSPDGRRLATAGANGTVKIWDAGTGR